MIISVFISNEGLDNLTETRENLEEIITNIISLMGAADWSVQTSDN